MAAVNYTVRLDESDKKAAEQVFNDLGLTLAAGFNVYIKAVVRQRRIPFDMTLNPQQKTAQNFLSAMHNIRSEGFSSEDEAALNDLQSGEYKPSFEGRLQT
jgi:DNA-damage-inducible protein J